MPPQPQPTAGQSQRLLEEALSLYRTGSHAAALDRMASVLRDDPNRLDALNLEGVILNAAGRSDEALSVLRRAIALAPDDPGIAANLGVALRTSGRLEEALAAYDRVLALAPGFAPAYVNRAGALFDLRRFDAALMNYDRALELRPDHPETLYRRGVVLAELGRMAEAVAAFGTALGLRPNLTDALVGRGDANRRLGRIVEALADYRAALARRPDDPGLPGLVLRQQMKLCDWTDFGRQSAELARRVAAGTTLLPPFASLSLLDAPDLQLAAARAWNAARGIRPTPPLPAAPHGGPIRLGYFSADFYPGHPTMLLMAEMLSRHDRRRFHVTGFHFNLPAAADTGRSAGLFEEFVSLDGRSDREAAAIARDRQLDIALDVGGFTRGSRPGIFAHRAAPVQVSYLAYAGTLGVGHIDYLVADPTLIGSQDALHYSERIVWMPHSYQPRDTRIQPADTPPRAGAGLPERGFVFCCFNAGYKLTPGVFSAWMEILARVPASVLWLLADKPVVMSNLRREAEQRGVDPRRLVFASRVSLPQHLGRLRLAGLVLDTAPYNAHTTASDALFAGVPLLTRPGGTFASRVGASLLTALGLPELIASGSSDYVERAVAIAADPGLAAALREKLAARSAASPLFDMAAYAANLEEAYETMAGRARDGLPPRSFMVDGQRVPVSQALARS